jgi:hypothetical protein
LDGRTSVFFILAAVLFGLATARPVLLATRMAAAPAIRPGSLAEIQSRVKSGPDNERQQPRVEKTLTIKRRCLPG